MVWMGALPRLHILERFGTREQRPARFVRRCAQYESTGHFPDRRDNHRHQLFQRGGYLPTMPNAANVARRAPLPAARMYRRKVSCERWPVCSMICQASAPALAASVT